VTSEEPSPPDLPPGWEWLDYDLPAISGSSPSALINVDGDEFRTAGIIPVEIRSAFASRCRELGIHLELSPSECPFEHLERMCEIRASGGYADHYTDNQFIDRVMFIAFGAHSLPPIDRNDRERMDCLRTAFLECKRSHQEHLAEDRIRTLREKSPTQTADQLRATISQLEARLSGLED